MQRSQSALALALAAAVAGAGPARAALDFHTYRILKNVARVQQSDGSWADSAYTTYELTRLGSASLSAASLTLTSHGGYLGVVEEATLTGNVENRPRDITRDFLLQGSLPIQPLAAVHGLTVFHGDTAYRAALRKQVYSLDDLFFDTLALRATLDGRVTFLQQLSDQSFEAAFSKLTLGEPVRIRLEYELPFPGPPGTQVRVPVVFKPSGARPRQIQINFSETAAGQPAVQWMGDNGRVNLDDGTLTLDYRDEYLFRRDEDNATAAALQMTGFEAGGFKGEYLLFKGGLKDSLMDVLSRPLETAFLWRWNPPFDFVEFRDGLKTLSAKGRLAAAEARALRQVVTQMAPHGHRFGLMHSVAGKEPVWFPPADTGSEGYARMLAYLDGFSEARIYADYKDYRDPRPDWAATVWKDSGEVIGGRNEFLADLAVIRGGFSQRPGFLRHIHMFGVGTTPATEIDLKEPGPIEAVLDSVTLSQTMASWLGVNLGAALKLKANADLRPVAVDADLGFGPLTLMLPVFQPASVEYRAFAGGRSYSVVMPFAGGAGREAMLKADAAFEDSLQLQGIDALGRKTRVHTLAPRTLRVPGDSGLARLWAADPDRIAERGESDIGMRYGILTKGTYLSAGVSDGKLESGSPISIPKSIRVAPGRSFRIRGNALVLESPDRIAAGAWIELFDLRGRSLGRIDLEPFRTGNGFALPLERLARFGIGRLLVVLRGAGSARSFTLVLGGRP